MSIELTDEEREAVRRGTCQASGPKALRIIDQLTSALEAEREDRVRLHEAVVDWKAIADRDKVRAEALAARVAELESQVANREAVCHRLVSQIARDTDSYNEARTALAEIEASHAVATSELARMRMSNRECQEVASRNAADAAHLRQTAIAHEAEIARLRERVERVIREADCTDASRSYLAMQLSEALRDPR